MYHSLNGNLFKEKQTLICSQNTHFSDDIDDGVTSTVNNSFTENDE